MNRTKQTAHLSTATIPNTGWSQEDNDNAPFTHYEVVEAFQDTGKQTYMNDDTKSEDSGLGRDEEDGEEVTALNLFCDGEDAEDEENCTMEELKDLFATLHKDFRNNFATIRRTECAMARKLLGHSADDPMLHPYERLQVIKRVLENDTMAKLETFGYRKAGPHKLEYWLEAESNIPDISVKDGSIVLDDFPKELINHVYIHHVNTRKRRTHT
jgi:hypothetical protein